MSAPEVGRVELLSIRYGEWFVMGCDDVEGAYALARAQSQNESASPDAVIVGRRVVAVRQWGSDFYEPNAEERAARAERYRRATGTDLT